MIKNRTILLLCLIFFLVSPSKGVVLKNMEVKMNTNWEEQVKEKVKSLIYNGTNYNVDELEKIYHEDLKIVKINEISEVQAINKAQNMEFFRKKMEAGDKPLSAETEFNYVEADEKFGHVIVTRKMQMEEREEKLIFSLHLKNSEKGWQILRETAFVQPL